MPGRITDFFSQKKTTKITSDSVSENETVIQTKRKPTETPIESDSEDEPLIQTKRKPTTQLIESESEDEVIPTPKIFYRDALLLQKTKCTKNACVQSKSLIERQIKEMESKKKKTEEAIATCKSIIAKKEHTIEVLKKESFHVKESEGSNRSVELIFDEFASEFTQSELADLRLIGGTQREDSTFISLSIKFLYKDKLHTLQKKSVTGRSKPGMKKECFSPEKVKILSSMLQKRLANSTDQPEERVARNKRLNELIKSAQLNISKSLKKKEVENELIRRLNNN